MGNMMEKVLSCSTLPSLPGVAMKVLDLTRDRNVSIAALGEAVQLDPALSTKVLKTVNSSYYGLSTPCPSITRAMSMLGLNTVKSIVLGFSLVDFTKSLAGSASGFDLPAYWRRAVYSAAAARAVAKATRRCDAEEAFVAALVADIGVLASLAALRGEYLEALTDAPEDHDEMVALERSRLGFDHAQVGKELATRWRLPGMLVASIAHHHNEAECAPAYMDMVRCVVLGRFAAGALTYRDAKRKLGSFLVKSGEWFSLSRDEARLLMQTTQVGANELSKLLDLKTGASADVESILADAQDQMVMTQVELQKQNEELARQTVTDTLTGAFNRGRFNQELARLTTESTRPMGILFIDADKFKSVNDTHGHGAGDAVLKELTKRVTVAAGEGAIVCRYGGEEFAVLLEGQGLDAAVKAGEAVRRAVESSEFELSGYGDGLPTLAITISVGVSVWEAGSGFTGAQVTAAADAGVYAAKKSGRNKTCVCKVGAQPTNLDGTVVQLDAPAPASAAHASPTSASAQATKPAAAKPVAKPAPSGTAGVATTAPAAQTQGKGVLLIVEDDPLAAKLMELLFGKRTDLQVQIVDSGEAALQFLTTPGKAKPIAVLADMNLPGITGINLVAMVSTKLGKNSPPFVIVTAGNDERAKALALKGGASLYLNKGDLCANFEQAYEQIRRVITQHASVRQMAA
jgi:diguanylate cyclase (GGDEF)-like protein